MVQRKERGEVGKGKCNGSGLQGRIWEEIEYRDCGTHAYVTVTNGENIELILQRVAPKTRRLLLKSISSFEK